MSLSGKAEPVRRTGRRIIFLLHFPVASIIMEIQDVDTKESLIHKIWRNRICNILAVRFFAHTAACGECKKRI